MYATIFKILGLAVCLAMLAPVQAAEVNLHGVQFPEKQPVKLAFGATPIAPQARVSGEVVFRNGQARIELSYDAMKPAILFGGDVTCFVVWAVTRDGQAENLGELLTRKRGGKVSFSTGKKNFAIMVTAESYYLVSQPSELVVFRNTPHSVDTADSKAFIFERLAPAPRHSMDAIAHILWDSKVPLDLLQARKAYELATRHEAEKHARQIYNEAGAALKGANALEGSPRSRELLDAARRAVALSNEALNVTMHRIEALEVERRLAERRAETAALEQRAAEAEAAAQAAQRMADDARRLAEEVRAEKERTMAETAALRAEKSTLESVMASLRQEKVVLQGEADRLTVEKVEMERESARLISEKNGLEAESQRLLSDKTALQAEAQRLREEKLTQEQVSRRLESEKAALEEQSRRLKGERDELSGRLQNALSHVADTQQSARGFVINLPDILFDLNEASLKPEAQLVLAKLAGILLIMPNQGATIEGHTDSTGSAEYNLDLSQRRATAVKHFLQLQGLGPARLHAVGFGMEQPVADNSSADGRKRNRRVEIVISETGEEVASN